MKAKILTTILALFLTLVIQAQERIINLENPPANYIQKKGDYMIDNRLNKYVGNYTFSGNNNFTFKMTLFKKKLCDNYIEVCYDRLYGIYEYKKGNTIVYKKEGITKNTLELSDLKILPIQILGNISYNAEVELRIKDELKNKWLNGVLTKLENGKYSLKISDNIERLIMTEKDKTLPGMTLPSEMILTKIE